MRHYTKATALRSIGLSPVETFPLRLTGYPKQLLQYASFMLVQPKSASELPKLAEQALKGNAVTGGIMGVLRRGARGTQGEILGGVPGEIAVREFLADMTSEALSRYPNAMERDRDISVMDPNAPEGKKGKKSKGFAAETMGAFPTAEAWVGVAPEPIKATQRSVAAARVRVAERRILAKNDSEVRLQLRKLKGAQMTSED